MKKVAIVILNWNGEQMLRRFLPSVLQYSEAVADIVVADNASTDASLALLEKKFPTVRTILIAIMVLRKVTIVHCGKWSMNIMYCSTVM